MKSSGQIGKSNKTKKELGFGRRLDQVSINDVMENCELLANARLNSEEENRRGPIMRQLKGRSSKLEDDLPIDSSNKRFEKFIEGEQIRLTTQSRKVGDIAARHGISKGLPHPEEGRLDGKVKEQGYLSIEVKQELVHKVIQERDLSGCLDDLILLGTRKEIMEDIRLCQEANYSRSELESLIPHNANILLDHQELEGGGERSAPSSDMGPNEPDEMYTHYSDPRFISVNH